MAILNRIVACALFAAAPVALADISEGFDDITTLAGAGWVTQNNSVPLGTTSWFQGNPTVFNSHAGAPNSYIAVNFNSGASVATISNWLITPEQPLANGSIISFYTRTASNQFPDRLQVRLSESGASTNVGGTAASVGDFGTLLLDINPAPGANYPTDWTQYNIVLSGITGTVNGRIALRYFVENGGPFGDNSNYIGVDTFSYTFIPAPASVATFGLGGLVLARRRR